MDSQDYEASFEVLLSAALAKLAVTPWDVELLKEVRQLGLRRKAKGLRDKALPKTKSGDKDELLGWYRQMAWEPTRVETLIEISRISEKIAKSLEDGQRASANKVHAWVVDLAQKMVGE